MMGLVALVPSRDGGTLTVLLKDMQEAHAMHVPVLIYECDNKGCMGDGYDIARRIGRMGHGSPGLLLNGEQVEIVSKLAEKQEFKMPPTVSLGWPESWIGAVPKSQAKRGDPEWIPRISDIIPGSSVVRPIYLEDNPNAKRSLLAARLTLNKGTLSTYSLADVGGRVQSMTFHEMGSGGKLSGFKRAVADVVMFTVMVDDHDVKLKLTKFNGTGTPRYLALNPNKDGKYPVVDILLGNLSPLDRSFDRKAPAEHFALYTKFSKAPKKAFEVPVPHLGMRGVEREKVEEKELPPVIQAVNSYISLGEAGEEGPTESPAEASGGQGGTNRPICTVAIMDAPVYETAQSAVHGEQSDKLDKAYNLMVKDVLPLPGVTGVEERCGSAFGGTLRIIMRNDQNRHEIGRIVLDSLGVARPKDLGFRLEIKKNELRVEKASSPPPEKSPMDVSRPLVAGVSIGLKNNSSAAGTLGMFVRNGGNEFFITAAHVLDGDGRVCQPAPSDHTCGMAVGQRVKWADEVDAALVNVNDVESNQVYNRVQFAGIRTASCEDTYVKKYGRSTRSTKGLIGGFGTYEVLLDDEVSSNIRGFTIVPLDSKNLYDEEISAPGDSGAVWYVTDGDGKNWGVGLHVGGESDPEPEKELAVATNLTEVFYKLGLNQGSIEFPPPEAGEPVP
jgi:hypothetical protein